MLDLLFPLHPKLVHFPIALGLVGIAAAVIGLLIRNKRLEDYGRLSLLLAWIGAIVAAVAGLIDKNAAPATPVVTAAIEQHITVAIALIATLGLALYMRLRQGEVPPRNKSKWAYVALLLVAMALILLEGYLGGRLVYYFGLGAIP